MTAGLDLAETNNLSLWQKDLQQFWLYSVLPSMGDRAEELREKLGPTRYQIVMLAIARNMRQVDVARELRISQPAVSKHLRVARRIYPNLPSRHGRHRVQSLATADGLN